MITVSPQMQSFDSYLTSLIPPEGSGAAILVQKAGQVLLRKGYGLANLELCVPIEPEMVFRIGSVTKQFTAVAILLLMEQGKLQLDDPIEKFLPDYPTHGHIITVEHLLTHTSGIKSYTGMPEFWQNKAKDMTPTELVDFFKFQPMDFAPGKRFSYSNSGYSLLGVIIEKVSGLSYAEFLQKHIFDPLGMAHTCFDNPTRIIPRRASGYTKGPQGWANADYISLTTPYAAGGLASTVDDLACWNTALVEGKLLQPETLRRAWTPTVLPDGEKLFYAFGWMVGEWRGWTWIEHGGGIQGFGAYGLYLPSQQIYVVVLTNTEVGEPSATQIAVRAAGEAAGQPFADPEAISLPPAALAHLEGTYQIPGAPAYRVFAVEDHLEVEFAPGMRMPYNPIEPLVFISPRDIFTTLRFKADESGQIIAAELQGRFGKPQPIPRVNESAGEDVKGEPAQA